MTTSYPYLTLKKRLGPDVSYSDVLLYSDYLQKTHDCRATECNPHEVAATTRLETHQRNLVLDAWNRERERRL